MTAYLWRLVK